MRLLALMACLPLVAADYWVSPTGSDGNPGTYSAPWAITKVCRATRGASPISAVSAGDTVWFRGGVYAYNQTLYCDLMGASGNEITLRVAPGEFPYIRATQMGFPVQLAIGGSYLKVIGLGAVYSGARIETAGGSNPVVQVPVGFNVASELLGNPTGVKLINCWSYGNSGTISATSSDHGTLYYGGVNFDQGSDGPDRLHGGFSYIQNNISNGVETHEQMVSLLQPYWYNYRVYTTSGTTSGVTTKNSILLGGTWVFQNLTGDDFEAWLFSGNFVDSAVSQSSQSQQGLVSSFVNNNTFTRYTSFKWAGSGNSFSGNRLAGAGSHLFVESAEKPTMSGNSYFQPDIYCYFDYYSGSRVNWTPAMWESHIADWADVGSTCTTANPAENWLKLYPNEYEPGRAHIAVYSWTSATSQSVDVSSVLNVGDRYELIDLWTPLSAPVATGAYAGGSIDVPLTGTDYYTPWGMGAAGNTARPKACWETDRANCLTSGDYVVAASVEELPAGTTLHQPALLSSNYAVYYWSGSAWASAGVTMQTHAGPEYQRETNAHAFLLRRVYDGRSDTTLTWRGAITDTVQAGTRTAAGVYQWGQLPVHSVACSGGICSARVPQPVGDAYWRVNGGAALRMAAR